VAIAAALRGAGGYGKTTLARAICHNEQIREAFRDGILWITLGQTPNVLGQLLKLYDALTGERPALVDVEDGANKLAGALDGRHCLIVIDDVWNQAHLRPFLRGGDNCARLVTTRNSDTLPAEARTVNVDAMQQNEATSLLSAGLPGSQDQALGLRELAARLGDWPLLLRLANSALRVRIDTYRQSLGDALAYTNRLLDKRGLTAFDARDAEERDQAAAMTLGLSTNLLSEDDRERYAELAVFPEDVDIPVAALVELWGATGGLDDVDTEDLCVRLDQLSLLLHCDLETRCIRLHDVVRAYLVREQGKKLPGVHGQLLGAYALDRWPDLSADEPYLWHHLAYHLREAERSDDLQALLLNPDWMQAKLQATSVNALLADYDVALESEGKEVEDLRLVQGALRLSAHILAQDQAQLCSQLYARLLPLKQPGIRDLLHRLRVWQRRPWLRLVSPTLASPGRTLLLTLSGHPDAAVWTMAVTADGKRAVSGSSDTTLKVWDLESGQELRTLSGHAGGVSAVALTADGKRAVSGSVDRTLKVWDVESGTETCTLVGHTKMIFTVAVTADGKRAVSGSDDHTLKVWDVESGTETCTLSGHTDRVSAVALTADGKRAVSGSDDTTLKVWDLESGTEVRTLSGHTDRVMVVALTADGKHAVSGSDDGTLKVWDLGSGAELRTLFRHARGISAVALTADGKRAVSGSRDTTLKVWDVESGAELRTLSGHGSQVSAVAVTADGKHAVSGSYDSTLKVWDLESGAEECALSGHSWSVWAVALTTDGKHALSGSDDYTLKVWDVESGTELRTLSGHTNSVWAVALTADGKHAVSGSWDHTLKVWDVESGTELRTLSGHTSSVRAVALTADGKRAVSGSWDHTLKVWDVESGTELRTLSGHTSSVSAVALTADGKRAVSGSNDTTLKVWDVESGTELRTLSGHAYEVTAVAVTADGKYAVSVSGDTLKVWDLESGTEVRTLSGHTDWVSAVAVTADGKHAVSGSGDHTLKVWDLESGQVIAAFSAEGSLYECAVASDGTIVTGGSSGRVHFLQLENDDLS
jgi:WD40 repeat protein